MVIIGFDLSPIGVQLIKKNDHESYTQHIPPKVETKLSGVYLGLQNSIRLGNVGYGKYLGSIVRESPPFSHGLLAWKWTGKGHPFPPKKKLVLSKAASLASPNPCESAY